jgi:hypothetical protein
MREMHVAMTKEALGAAMAAGELRDDVRIDDAVVALVGIVDQRCHAFVLEGRAFEADLPERVLDIFYHGVAP